MMNGIVCTTLLKKVAVFAKTLSKNNFFCCTSKQPSLVQKASFTSLPHFLPLITPQIHQIFDKHLAKHHLWSFSLLQANQVRNVTKFSYQKGARKSVKAVRDRFFRLHWGIWIRTIAGRHKKLWKKTNRRRNTLLRHVFCNHTQSKMLDKMVNRFWRVPKYYIEDPYTAYHTRENFFNSKRKPWRPDGVDYE